MDRICLANLYNDNTLESPSRLKNAYSNGSKNHSIKQFDLKDPRNVVLDFRPFNQHQLSRIKNSFPLLISSKNFESSNLVDLLRNSVLNLHHLKVLSNLFFVLKNTDHESSETKPTMSQEGDLISDFRKSAKIDSSLSISSSSLSTSSNSSLSSTFSGPSSPSTSVISNNSINNHRHHYHPINPNNCCDVKETTNVIFYSHGKHFDAEAKQLYEMFVNFASFPVEFNKETKYVKIKDSLKFFYINEPLCRAMLGNSNILDTIPVRDTTTYSQESIVKREISTNKLETVLEDENMDNNAIAAIYGQRVFDTLAYKLTDSKTKKRNSLDMNLNAVSFFSNEKQNVDLKAKKKFQKSMKNNFKLLDALLGDGSKNEILDFNSNPFPGGANELPKPVDTSSKLPKWLLPYLDAKQATHLIQREFNKIEKLQEKRVKKAFYMENCKTLESTVNTNINTLLSEVNQGIHSPSICSPGNLCPGCDHINYKLPTSYLKAGFIGKPENVSKSNNVMVKKNRYYNILPFEHSRVKLPQYKQFIANKPSTESASNFWEDSYINANYIKVPQISHEAYIATQDPTKSTFTEFWSMVSQNPSLALILKLNSNIWNIEYYRKEATRSVVRDLSVDFNTKGSHQDFEKVKQEILDQWSIYENSDKNVKDGKYLAREKTIEFFRKSFERSEPGNATESLRLQYFDTQMFPEDGLILQNLGYETIINHKETIIRLMDLVELETISLEDWNYYSKVFLEKGGGDIPLDLKLPKIKRSKCIVHVELLDWNDFSALKDLDIVFKLITLKRFIIDHVVDELNNEFGTVMTPNHNLKSLVHCNAGCGRTGTFVTVDMIVNRLSKPQDAKKEGREVEAQNFKLVGNGDMENRENQMVDLFGKRNVIYKTVAELRKQRLSMVQNINQYRMCYDALIMYFAEKKTN